MLAFIQHQPQDAFCPVMDRLVFEAVRDLEIEPPPQAQDQEDQQTVVVVATRTRTRTFFVLTVAMFALK